MSKIDKLTPSQEKEAKKYVADYEKIALTTERCDRAKAEKAFEAYYKYKDYGAIKRVIWFEDPISAAYYVAKAVKVPYDDNRSFEDLEALIQQQEVTQEDARDVVSKACYGSFEAYWVCFYVFCREELKLPDHPLIDICDNIAKDTGVAWFCKDYVIATERPKSITKKDNQIESIGDNPAVEYYNGVKIFARNGKRYATLLQMKLDEKGTK